MEEEEEVEGDVEVVCEPESLEHVTAAVLQGEDIHDDDDDGEDDTSKACHDNHHDKYNLLYMLVT